MNRVELVGFYGNDILHGCSAWTSTSRDLTDEKIERLPNLLKFLADNQHETPFEKSAIHFLVDSDIASHIHKLKHRIGVSINAESARYKELKEDKYHIPDDWPESWRGLLEEHTKKGQELYHSAIASLSRDFGLTRKRAKESARYFLGYNTVIMCEIMFNFRSFMHFQKLRNEEHAQKEIRDIAKEMLRLVWETGAFNHSLEAFGYQRDVL